MAADFRRAGTYRLNGLLVTNQNATVLGSSAGNVLALNQTRFVPHGTNYAVIAGDDKTRMHGARFDGITFVGDHVRPRVLWVNGGMYRFTFRECAFGLSSGTAVLVGGNTNAPISLGALERCRLRMSDTVTNVGIHFLQTTNWPAAFVTAIDLDLHIEQAGAPTNSWCMIIDSVQVTASSRTYGDLGSGFGGILFRKSLSSVAPKMDGDFTLETNGGGPVAKVDFATSRNWYGDIFSRGWYHLQGSVQWADGSLTYPFGRGVGPYQIMLDYPAAIGDFSVLDSSKPADQRYTHTNENRLYASGGRFVMAARTNELYLTADANSITLRGFSTNQAHYSAKIDATPVATNHAMSVGNNGGAFVVTGQGRAGVRQDYPQADLVVGGGISAGVNSDPGGGFVQASKGFVIPGRTMAQGDTVPIRSTGHTLTSANGGVTNMFLTQLGAVTGNGVAYPGASAYQLSLSPRHNGSAYWGFMGGGYISTSIEGAGALGTASALRLQPASITSSGNLGAGMGLEILAPSYSSSGVATSIFGIYINSMSAAGNAYAFYSNDGLVRFGDDVTIANGQTLTTSAPTNTFDFIAGWSSDPSTTTQQLRAMSKANAQSWLGVVTPVEGDGIRITGSTVSLDILAGSNVSLATNGSGQITISASGGGGGPTNGSAVYIKGVQAAAANFVSSTEVDPSISGTNVSLALHANSIETNKLSVAAYQALVNRATHTGTQLASTISDFSTNVWMKLLASLLRGNGIHFATNGPSNLLTISGWNLPGSNLSAVTNGDGSITWSAVASSATNGTPLSVNGGTVLSLANLLDTVIAKWTATGSNITLVITNLQQSAVSNLVADLAAKQAANSNLLQIATAAGNPGDILYRHASGVLTNLPVGSSGHVLTVASGAPAWQAASGGGGGAGTNFWLNGVLQQPARITNSTTVTWSTNANGDVIATAQGANATYTTNRVDVPIFTSVDAVTVPDTTTNETSLVGTLKSGQSKMLAANALANGTIIRVRANGTLSASGDWSNGAFRVRIGGRVLTAQLYEPDSLTPSNLPWELTAYLAVTAAGSSASNTAVGVLSYGHGSAGSVGANMLNMVASGTLNTTVTNAVDVTFENDGTQPVTLACRVVEAYELAEEFITGGSGQFFAEGQLVQNPNLIAGAGLMDTISGTNITIALAGHTPISGARSGFRVWDDLLSASTTQGDAGTVGVNNSGSVNVTAGEPGRPGIKFVRTTGANQMPVWSWRTADMMRMTNAAGLERWRFECGLKTPATLSGSANTDQYSLRAGFSTLPNTTNTPTDSVAFVHQTNLLGSVNWAFQTINNSTATTTDTGVAVTASTWYDLIADLTPTNAIATINGVAVATNTVGIPLSRQMGVGVQQQRYSGTTTIDCLVDYISLSYSGTLR